MGGTVTDRIIALKGGETFAHTRLACARRFPVIHTMAGMGGPSLLVYLQLWR